ncbi:copper chaperone PCu(A)C [Shinella zoogloeoides]|uniref:Copper chaperone PCu(A)C n=1 Tax=Shinella zoogloeoides TaxID=352475 RepID=A0A6N8TH37_SHIZO|nr:copper chaperone PCu(A)C [Shinella zoogloeoides]MXO01941.1 copper chaperone PCu(A)C [Shinella zoogloeoides]UEX84479.1 copper chaperone PCu(A)C [Shinella zoogloeoides]
MRMIACAATMFATTLPAFAAGASDDLSLHDNPPRALLVEHAELLVVDQPSGQTKGFLTIWNGTDGEMRLSSVASETFRSVSTLSSQPADDVSQQRRFEDFVPIPAHAELRMQPNGIRLLLGDPVSDMTGRQADRLTLMFDDGTKLEVIAKIVSSRDELVRHHHGQVEADPG